MKSLLVLIMILFTAFGYANTAKVELSPAKPVAGEVFQAIFHIYTDADEEPSINFNPYRVEVVGKSNQGIRTSTSWINGKFSTSREMTIVYDLAASSPGPGGLREITITVGSKTIRQPALNFTILKEAEMAADVFVSAEVPKKSLFVGEGIVVRYFIYTKVPVTNLDIKRYPKLNNFLKRFLQEPERSERVTVDGEMYTRTQLYGAKLFPEKPGELKIDGLQLTASVSVSRGSDPFGTFGFGREFRTKTMSSEPVTVKVMPLPEAGKPANFTGLVGKHDFDLQLNNTKFIVNEPLEIKLTISGGGALENLEAPVILKNSDLEEFESNGDLKIMDADQATKIFDYTFLPKANMTLPASRIALHYFDPDSMRYVPVELSLAEITIAGASEKRPTAEKSSLEPKQDNVQKQPLLPSTLAAPSFKDMPSWGALLSKVNLILAGASFLIALGFLIRRDKLPTLTKHTIPSHFRKGDFQLSDFTRWLSPLIAKTGKSPKALIKDSELSEESKAYFIDLLNSNDYKDYSSAKRSMKFDYRAAYFKELDRYIQSVKNENPSQPS